MRIIENQTFDEERALYGVKGVRIERCTFDGPADGESAVKECSDIVAEDCDFRLRYPFWHVHGLDIRHCRMTEGCRAALWYSEDIAVTDSVLHGVKALRECDRAVLRDCDVKSSEFGWFSRHVDMRRCTVESDYFMLRAENTSFDEVRFKGKYALQYMRHAVFENGEVTSRDAFWHADHVTVRNCVLRGEFLGWYSDHLTLDHCRIIGSQPLCYCRSLRLIDCELVDTDLCFEKSDVDAVLTAPVESIKNPRSGRIVAPAVEEIIRDDEASEAEIVITGGSAA